MDLGERVIVLLRSHPAVRSVVLSGSRARHESTALSDWDFDVQVDDLDAFVADLPGLVEGLHPLGKQWDPYSDHWNYMLFLPGPVKVDIILEHPYEQEGPRSPSRENLELIDHHFWDWTLWLGSKQLRGETELVAKELQKMRELLLGPLGVEGTPHDLAEAIDSYLQARSGAEQRFGISLDRRMGDGVVDAFERTGLTG